MAGVRTLDRLRQLCAPSITSTQSIAEQLQSLQSSCLNPQASSSLSRFYAALPQLNPREPDGNNQYEDTHHRRLGEMQQQRHHNFVLPSVELVKQQLKIGSSSGCSTTNKLNNTQPQEDTTSNDQLDWRDVVARARALNNIPIPGDQMLTDTFGRRHTYLRISLTERCNLRCLYCMPEQGVDLTPNASLLTAPEIQRLAKLFVNAGVDKIRLTGGEPTLRSDLIPIIAGISSLEGVKAVGLTSNGLTLKKKLPELRKAGLTLLNLSLDTLKPERFEKMTRRPKEGHSRVLDSLHTALDLGFEPVKLNVVVMRGVNDDEINDFVELTKNLPINVRFIEYMPFDGNVWSDTKMVSYKDMKHAIESRFGRLERCTDPQGEVAKNFRVAGHVGEVSFVTSMTSAFCGDCNRLRVMADGNLKVCLFGANEVSLRDALREGATDDDLKAVVSVAVDRKKAAHAGMFELSKSKNRAMVKIGG